MGLDMYLKATDYVGNWNHSKPEEREKYAKIAEAVGLKDLSCEGSPHLTINICVAYWRKSNQIHAWFVKNVQSGEDDCGHYDVSREQLTNLLDECTKALDSKDATGLPPQSGFFFGSTDIDEYYWGDLSDTVKQLTAILANEDLKRWSFEYHSSW